MRAAAKRRRAAREGAAERLSVRRHNNHHIPRRPAWDRRHPACIRRSASGGGRWGGVAMLNGDRITCRGNIRAGTAPTEAVGEGGSCLHPPACPPKLGARRWKRKLRSIFRFSNRQSRPSPHLLEFALWKNRGISCANLVERRTVSVGDFLLLRWISPMQVGATSCTTSSNAL